MRCEKYARNGHSVSDDYDDRILGLPIVASCPEFIAADISKKIRKHENFPFGDDLQGLPYYSRTKPAQFVVVHHSAGQIKRGPIESIEGTNGVHIDERGWPCIAYHVYAPYSPLAVNDRSIVYQMNPFGRVTWHTYGGSAGVGILFQGYFDRERHPSAAQQRLAVSLIDWVLRANGLERDDVRGHFDFTKRECPGPWLEHLVREMRGEQIPPFDEWCKRWPRV